MPEDTTAETVEVDVTEEAVDATEETAETEDEPNLFARGVEALERIADALEEGVFVYVVEEEEGEEEGEEEEGEEEEEEPVGEETILAPRFNQITVDGSTVRVTYGRNPAELLIPTHEYEVLLDGEVEPAAISNGYAAFTKLDAGTYTVSIQVIDSESGDFSPVATREVTVE